MVFGVQQEWLERQYPTPPEWSYVSRQRLRFYNHVMTHKDDPDYVTDWVMMGVSHQILLDRLHDPKLDGADIEEPSKLPVSIWGRERAGYDISKKSEPWRRAYYNATTNIAHAAEHLDDWILDEKRNIAFPKALVIGPSNPNPKPIPPGSASAPKEEDCNDRLFPSPDLFYTRILTTEGFSPKQKVDAAIAYGTWLDFKKKPEAAREVYYGALDIATDYYRTPIFDRDTGFLKANAGLPSANLLAIVTAIATHHAAQQNLNTALPMFLSILRARKSLPELPEAERNPIPLEPETGARRILSMVQMLFSPPPHPPAPEDGTAPPFRTNEERCKDAGIMTNIGEILYASTTSAANKNDGLAWTREAVDIAEEEVRKFSVRDGDKVLGFIPVVEDQTKKTCKRCMEVGLSNWAKMVSGLAKEEREAKKAAPAKTGGWLGFGGVEVPEATGRWESELLVIRERLRRAARLLKIKEEDILEN